MADYSYYYTCQGCGNSMGSYGGKHRRGCSESGNRDEERELDYRAAVLENGLRLLGLLPRGDDWVCVTCFARVLPVDAQDHQAWHYGLSEKINRAGSEWRTVY